MRTPPTPSRAILAEDPGQTRVRLELARAMLGLGQTASADRQFRIAQQTDDLPPDIAAAIRGARQVIRSKRAWRFDMDLGIAPDSNINNATAAERIDVLFGDTTLPIDLDGNARARIGHRPVGQPECRAAPAGRRRRRLDPRRHRRQRHQLLGQELRRLRGPGHRRRRTPPVGQQEPVDRGDRRAALVRRRHRQPPVRGSHRRTDRPGRQRAAWPAARHAAHHRAVRSELLGLAGGTLRDRRKGGGRGRWSRRSAASRDATG